MAGTNNRLVWQDMKTKLAAVGGVARAVIGEPASGVQSGLVAIIPTGGTIPETVLNAPRERHAVILRRYENALQAPAEEIELRLDQWRADIFEDICGDFDLGGTIAYPEFTEFAWNYGYQTVENTIYRLLDLTLVYRIDPAATHSA